MRRRLAMVVLGSLLGPLAFMAAAEAIEPATVAVPVVAATNTTQQTTRGHVLVIAHRGFSAVAPENTVPAVEAAAAAGADMVELDVQRTSDGHPIVIHDKTFARTTDVATVFPGRAKDPVGSFSLAEVRRLDAGSWKGARFAGTQVPTLQAYVRAVQPTHMKMMLELKNPSMYPGYERQVADVLQAGGLTGSQRVVVNSFSTRALRAFHAMAPSVAIGLLRHVGIGDVVKDSWLQMISPMSGSITSKGVVAADAAGLEVIPWAGPGQDTATMIRRDARLGVAGVMTNRPDMARVQIDTAAAGRA